MKELLSYLQTHYGIGELGEITWAHAVNSQERLRRFLHDPQIMMLEADISLSRQGAIIAAHPPQWSSDLTFEELLQTIASSSQGIKFDFKDPEVLIPCLQALRDASLPQPVLLNADILQGHEALPSLFDAADFIAQCKRIYPQGILSIGWTTHGNDEGMYTRENVDAMLALCQDIEQATFPVRADWLPASWTEVARLIEHDGYSLTIWNGRIVDQELQSWLREHTDPAKTLYDLIDEQRNPLRLSR